MAALRPVFFCSARNRKPPLPQPCCGLFLPPNAQKCVKKREKRHIMENQTSGTGVWRVRAQPRRAGGRRNDGKKRKYPENSAGIPAKAEQAGNILHRNGGWMHRKENCLNKVILFLKKALAFVQIILYHSRILKNRKPHPQGGGATRQRSHRPSLASGFFYTIFSFVLGGSL